MQHSDFTCLRLSSNAEAYCFYLNCIRPINNKTSCFLLVPLKIYKQFDSWNLPPTHLSEFSWFASDYIILLLFYLSNVLNLFSLVRVFPRFCLHIKQYWNMLKHYLNTEIVPSEAMWVAVQLHFFFIFDRMFL